MKCQDTLEQLSEYLARNLSIEEANRFERHFAECPECREYLRSFQQVIRLGQAAWREPDDSVAANMPEELIQAILALRKP